MKHLLVWLVLLCGCLATTAANSHGGGLNGYGCHHNKKAGGYHCHRGELAGMFFLSKADMLEALSKKKTVKTQKQVSFPRLEGVVVRVFDGDTLRVRVVEEEITLRVYGIDAPEKKQEGGPAAKEFLEELLTTQRVTLEVLDTDKYGRSVAIVRLADGATVQSKVLAGGHAWVYPQYCRRVECSAWKEQEYAAKVPGLGLWAEANPTPPWQWRKDRKTRNM